MTESDTWAAGFFEGEGSVRISKPAARNWGSLSVDIANTDKSLVQFFADRWGGSISEHKAVGRRRAYWRWRASSRQAAAFLEAIRPFIRSRRILAKLEHGLAFQAQKTQRSDEKYREDQWNAYWWMAELNVRGVR